MPPSDVASPLACRDVHSGAARRIRPTPASSTAPPTKTGTNQASTALHLHPQQPADPQVREHFHGQTHTYHGHTGTGPEHRGKLVVRGHGQKQEEGDGESAHDGPGD